jgi:hypothetical protein
MRMNKKGAETMEVTPWIIVAVIAAVVVAYFVYTSFGKVSTVIDAQGVENKARIASCQTSFLSSLSGSTDADKFAKYCGTFEYPAVVGGEKGYTNCEFMQRSGVVSFTEAEISSTVAAKCNSDISNKLAYNKCLEFNNSKRSDNSNWVIFINGMECSRANALDVVNLRSAFNVDDSNLGTDGRYNIAYNTLP